MGILQLHVECRVWSSGEQNPGYRRLGGQRRVCARPAAQSPLYNRSPHFLSCQGWLPTGGSHLNPSTGLSLYQRMLSCPYLCTCSVYSMTDRCRAKRACPLPHFISSLKVTQALEFQEWDNAPVALQYTGTSPLPILPSSSHPWGYF